MDSKRRQRPLFSTSDLDQEEVEMITDIYNHLKVAYPEVKFDDQGNSLLQRFESIASFYTGLRHGPRIRLQRDGRRKDLCFLQLTYPGLRSKFGTMYHANWQTWGVGYLSGSYGHVLIRTETALDKVRELIHRAEIDFEEDLEFSRRFYVLADDEKKARELLKPSLRDAIMNLELEDFTIEIINNVIIVGDHKWANPSTAGEIARFLMHI